MNKILRNSLFGLTIFSLSSLSSVSSLAASSTTDLAIDDDIGVVLTPTRLKQAISDVPASVTVISADMLARYGIRTIPEALRLVPGMAVFQVSGGDYRISYHGTLINTPHRINVLIDGFSVYRSAFAQVDWTNLPIAIEDVQRIEVTRGPDSAAYGPNSMLATINIISKHPEETQGLMISGTGGTRGTQNGTVRYGGKLGAATTYRVTIDHEQNLGFNSRMLLPSSTPTNPISHDASHNNKFNFRSITEITPQQTLDVQLALVKAFQEVERTGGGQRDIIRQMTSPDHSHTEYDFNALWKNNMSNNHSVQVQMTLADYDKQLAWGVCSQQLVFLPQLRALWTANPSYVGQIVSGKVPSGGSAEDNLLAASVLKAIAALGNSAFTPTCGHVDEGLNEKRVDIELQDTYVVNNQLRFVGGIGFRRDLASSQTYFNGTIGNNTARIFANAEYKPLPNININLGGFVEKDQITGTSFSPRLGVNTHLNENNTLRFIVSKANRLPSIFEQRANWTYLVTNLTNPVNGGSNQGTFFQTASAPGNLKPERIISREIGWHGNFPQLGLVADAKLFSDNLSNLISEQLQLNDFSPSNNSSSRLRGFETQIDYSPVENWTVQLGYSYLQNDAQKPMERSLYSRNSGFVGVNHVLNNGWNVNLAMYGNQAAPNGFGQSAFSKQDLVVSKRFRLNNQVTVTPTFTVTHLSDPTISFMYNVGKFAQNALSDPMQYYVSLKVDY